jgi:hypothetical protein
VGGIVVVLGAGLFLGNITGFFPTIPFAGGLVLTAGGVLVWAGSAACISARARALGSPMTVELPLTREMYDCMKTKAARYWRIFIPISVACLLFESILGGFFLTEDDPLGPLHIMGPAGMGLVGLFWGIFLLQGWLNQWDQREDSYLRTAGPMSVWEYNGMHYMKMYKYKFPMSNRMVSQVTKSYSGEVGWLEVDHTRRGHFIFEVRTADGRVIYRDLGYTP